MADSSPIYGGEYVGPEYEFTDSVKNLRRLPRFGYTEDFTVLLSPDQVKQAEYAAGLISLFTFLLLFFIFWTILIITFKCMGPGNAGFLSGHHFVLPNPADDEKNHRRRPFRVRMVFLVAAATLMVYAILLVGMGLTNVDNTTTTMQQSLKSLHDLLAGAEVIAKSLAEVGRNSVKIRDDAVSELSDFCPGNPRIDEITGINVMGIADQAKADLTMLANFINDGIMALDDGLARVRTAASEMDDGLAYLDFWGWRMKLFSTGLFILPSFLVVGVGLVMLDLDVRPYQKALTHFFTPVFFVTIVLCYIFCALILPISATNADICTGGGAVEGGPDDTVLTVYRNLRGNETGIIFQLLAFYTQRCDSEYYPFGFLSTYLAQLDEAVASTGTVVESVQDNLNLLQTQCDRSFENVLRLVRQMNINLKILRNDADESLDLIKCQNINELYVNTAHEAACTYSVDALAWIFASSLIISVCGLIMIMLRAAYYPEEYLQLGDKWSRTSPTPSHESPTKFSPTHSADDSLEQRMPLTLARVTTPASFSAANSVRSYVESPATHASFPSSRVTSPSAPITLPDGNSVRSHVESSTTPVSFADGNSVKSYVESPATPTSLPDANSIGSYVECPATPTSLPDTNSVRSYVESSAIPTSLPDVNSVRSHVESPTTPVSFPEGNFVGSDVEPPADTPHTSTLILLSHPSTPDASLDNIEVSRISGDKVEISS